MPKKKADFKIRTRFGRLTAKLDLGAKTRPQLLFAACERLLNRAGSCYKDHWSDSRIPEVDVWVSSGKVRVDAALLRYPQLALVSLLIVLFCWFSLSFVFAFHVEVLVSGPKGYLAKVVDLESKWFASVTAFVRAVHDLVKPVPRPVLFYLLPLALIFVMGALDRHRTAMRFAHGVRQLALWMKALSRDVGAQGLPRRLTERWSVATELHLDSGSSEQDSDAETELIGALSRIGVDSGKPTRIGPLSRIPLLNRAGSVYFTKGSAGHHFEVFWHGFDQHIMWALGVAVLLMVASAFFVAYAVIPNFVPDGGGPYSVDLPGPITQLFVLPFWSISLAVSPALGVSITTIVKARAARQGREIARALAREWKRPSQ